MNCLNFTEMRSVTNEMLDHHRRIFDMVEQYLDDLPTGWRIMVAQPPEPAAAAASPCKVTWL